MSGGGGGVIIIKDAVAKGLMDPVVYGNLPATITGSLGPILAKDPCDWTQDETQLVAKATEWALLSLK
jgi:hypothetical protein